VSGVVVAHVHAVHSAHFYVAHVHVAVFLDRRGRREMMMVVIIVVVAVRCGLCGEQTDRRYKNHHRLAPHIANGDLF
jgi:hypothetical protein